MIRLYVLPLSTQNKVPKCDPGLFSLHSRSLFSHMYKIIVFVIYKKYLLFKSSVPEDELDAKIREIEGSGGHGYGYWQGAGAGAGAGAGTGAGLVAGGLAAAGGGGGYKKAASGGRMRNGAGGSSGVEDATGIDLGQLVLSPNKLFLGFHDILRTIQKV